jgi:hypothetical protein
LSLHPSVATQRTLAFLKKKEAKSKPPRERHQAPPESNDTGPSHDKPITTILNILMSVSIRSLFTPDELTLELEWLEARDTLLGEYGVKQDVKRALELAAASELIQCQWLTDRFAEKTVSIKEEARDVFLALGKNDARGLCFAALLDDSDEREESVARLRCSAELGCAFAQAQMADLTLGEEMFRFATLAAAQRERDGIFQLGCCFRHGWGCEKNSDKAIDNCIISAELGDVAAMVIAGRCLDATDSLRWVWWVKLRNEATGFTSSTILPNKCKS